MEIILERGNSAEIFPPSCGGVGLHLFLIWDLCCGWLANFLPLFFFFHGWRHTASGSPLSPNGAYFSPRGRRISTCLLHPSLSIFEGFIALGNSHLWMPPYQIDYGRDHGYDCYYASHRSKPLPSSSATNLLVVEYNSN